MTVNCLSFYNLVQIVSKGNAEPSALTSLLDASDTNTEGECDSSRKHVITDDLLGLGDIRTSESVLDSIAQTAPSDHASCIGKKSDSRLTCYMAGYVARKCILATKCEGCCQLLLSSHSKAAVESPDSATFTQQCDRGGLLYPSSTLSRFVSALEDTFTDCFSYNQLHHNSIMDVLAVVKQKSQTAVVCAEHAVKLTARVIGFYLVTRLHFFVKGLNNAKAARREKARHLKISRLT